MGFSRIVFGYVCLVGFPLLILLVIVNSGGHVTQPTRSPIPAVAPTSALPGTAASRLILQIIVILIATRLCGAVLQRIGQPRVIGEMVAGVILGPSFFGWLAPSVSSAIFPKSSLGHLEALSQLGLVIFMFLVGASLDTKVLRAHCEAAILTSHVSIVMPLLLGAGLAWLIYPELSGAGVTFMAFALFMGTAMSITAFPVLARILSERNLLRSRVGTLAIACAAVDDVTGWCILAGITVLIRASHSAVPIWLTLAGSLAFAVFMIGTVRPLLKRFQVAGDGAIGMAVLFLLFSSLITEFLGIHLLFGAFLAGAVMPPLGRLQERFEPFCLTVLMPLFFAFTGLRTNLGLVWSAGMWPIFVLIMAVAVAGKLGGATLAARLTGFGWRDAAAVGSLLNTRGLMELVILNIGLDVGILTPTLFALMVLMAILTTLMTAPLLHLFGPPCLAPAQVPHQKDERLVEVTPG